jgi:molybdopterin/thiamine biosynthesis adenylyltransferase
MDILNRSRRRWVKATTADLDRMTPEQLNEVDLPQMTYGSLGFTVNLAACLVAAEAIKLLTGRGKTILYPQVVYLDVFNQRLKIFSKYAPGQILTKIWQRVRNR